MPLLNKRSRRRRRQRPPKLGNITKKSRYLLITKTSLSKWLALLILIIIIAYGWFSPILRVSYIDCSVAADTACDPNVLAELDHLKDQHTFLVDVRALEKKLQSADPSHGRVEVEARLPHTIKVRIGNKQPVANIRTSTSSATLIADESFQIIAKQDEPIPGLSTIVSQQSNALSVGDTVTSPGTQAALTLITELDKNFIPHKDIIVNADTEIIVDIDGKKKAIFSSQKNIAQQATSLQLILSKATIGVEQPTFDMRFDKPVIK